MREEAKIWLERAEHDFNRAKKNFKIKEFELVAFLCQQSVEKGLKALCIDKFEKIVKTHDLMFLCSMLNSPKEISDACNRLNPVYTETRYPDKKSLTYEYDKKDAIDFLKDCEAALSWIKKQK